MAVPKKKRYKQVIKTRRSSQKSFSLLKENLSITKFSNYINNDTNYSRLVGSCSLCNNHFLWKKRTAYCTICCSIKFKTEYSNIGGLKLWEWKTRNWKKFEIPKALAHIERMIPLTVRKTSWFRVIWENLKRFFHIPIREMLALPVEEDISWDRPRSYDF